MKLKSMKMSKKESKDSMPSAMPEDVPQYPYGLQIRLEKDSIENLGIGKLPEVGDEMKLHAIVKVTGVSENESIYGSHRGIELQITEMAMGEDAE